MKPFFINNIDLALNVMNYYHGGIIDDRYSYHVKKFIRSYASKKDCLLAAIQLCGYPTTPKQLYIVSSCYVLCGASYRPQAIEFLNKYINVGAVWEGTPCDNFIIDGHIINQLDLNRAAVYCDLGKAYEGEYQFDNALKSYFNAIKFDPSCTPAIAYSADVFVKKNLIDAGLNFLTNFKNSPFKDVRSIARSKTQELKDKKSKGYVYKARPRKNK